MPSVVICCFCGLELPEKRAVLLAIYPTPGRDETQAVYAHHRCLTDRLRPEVPRHPGLESE